MDKWSEVYDNFLYLDFFWSIFSNFSWKYRPGNNSFCLHLNINALGVEPPKDGGVDLPGGLDLHQGVGLWPSEETGHLPPVQSCVLKLRNEVCSYCQGHSVLTSVPSLNSTVWDLTPASSVILQLQSQLMGLEQLKRYNYFLIVLAFELSWVRRWWLAGPRQRAVSVWSQLQELVRQLTHNGRKVFSPLR